MCILFNAQDSRHSGLHVPEYSAPQWRNPVEPAALEAGKPCLRAGIDVSNRLDFLQHKSPLQTGQAQ